jgi:pimeloyl-ACP methyl ester carboxylesterase
MPNVSANGIRIEYETFGDPSSPPLLLISGLGRQMISWVDSLCDQLAEKSHYAIRFDNRDVGLSSKMDSAGEPNMTEVLNAHQAGDGTNIPYTIDDMADDAIGLLDALCISAAHVCGVSMGGMIAQAMAIRYPSRVWSLISMQSTTGAPDLPPARPEAKALLLTPPPTEREAHIEHMVNLFRVFAGSGVLLDEDLTRRLVEQGYDRCHYRKGVLRQAAAVFAAGDRTRALNTVIAPTLVIHGSEDPIVPVEHGKATAAAVRHAELLIIEGMGHGMTFPEVWPLWVDAIAAHTRNARGRAH